MQTLLGPPPMRHLNLSPPPSQTSSGFSHPLTVSQGLSGDLQMTDFDLIFILSIHLYPTTFPQSDRGGPPSRFSAPQAHLSRGLWMPSRTPDNLLSGHSRVYQCVDIFPSDELCGCACFRTRIRSITPVCRHNSLIQILRGESHVSPIPPAYQTMLTHATSFRWSSYNKLQGPFTVLGSCLPNVPPCICLVRGETGS